MSFYSMFAQYYEEIFPFSPGVFSFLQRYSKPMQRCLDVGCGSGHYAGQLAVDGYDVTGIDLDAAMIDFALSHYPSAIFEVMDMRKITELGGGYDFVYCIGNSGAHLPQADFRRFLADLRKVLNPGGRWILQLMNWDYVLRQDEVHFPVIKTESDLTFTRAYTHISPESVQFETALLSDDAFIFEDSVPLYPAVSPDVIAMHMDLGFELLAHFGSYAGSAFDPGVFSASIYVFSAPEELAGIG